MSVTKTVYVLNKANDNYDDASSIVIGVYASRQEAIEAMDDHASYTLERYPHYILENPPQTHNFEYLYDFTKEDYENIFIFQSDYYYHDSNMLHINNPWTIKVNYTRYMHNCDGKNVQEFVNSYFGNDKEVSCTDIFDNYYSIYCMSTSFNIYFRSLVKYHEYVIGILTKLYNILDSENSKPGSENYENSELYKLIQAITNEDFEKIGISFDGIFPHVEDDDVYYIETREFTDNNVVNNSINYENNVNNASKTVYVLNKSIDNYDDYSSILIGVYSSKEKAIKKMHEDAKNVMDKNPDYELKNPDLDHEFEYLFNINTDNYDYENIFIYVSKNNASCKVENNDVYIIEETELDE